MQPDGMKLCLPLEQVARRRGPFDKPRDRLGSSSDGEFTASAETGSMLATETAVAGVGCWTAFVEPGTTDPVAGQSKASFVRVT